MKLPPRETQLLVGSGRRRRRHRRALLAVPDDRRDLRIQIIVGVLVVSGLTAAIAAPAEDWATRRPSSYLYGGDPGGTYGQRVGSAIVTPSLDVAGMFDNNVFAASRNERSDWFASFMPALDVESDLPRHAYSLRAQGEFRQYATHTRENISNAGIAGTGRLDLAPDAYLIAGGSYQQLHEDRGALVAVNGINPTPYTVASGKAGFAIDRAPFGVRLDATVDSYAYSNVTLFNGAIVNETARDRLVYALQPRILYRVLPQYDAFLQAVVNRRQYGSARLPDGLGRSSTGWGVAIGSAFDLARFVAGEVYLGYIGQNYRTTVARPIEAVDFGGNLEWRPLPAQLPATALRLNLSRSIEESAALGSPGYLQTAFRLGGQHEAMPRFVLAGSVGYINADFAGSGGNSDLYEARIGAHYAIAANISAGLEYNVGYRASSAALPNYTRQIIELRVRGQL
jgi:hypothetical protein